MSPASTRLAAAAALAEATAAANGSGASLERILTDTSRATEGWRSYEGSYTPTAPRKVEEGRENTEESDAESTRRELLLGWARTGLLGRLRFLLHSGELTQAGRSDALGLLCRFAGRSSALASDVARTPHLMDALKDTIETADAPVALLERALALLQLLLSASRQICRLVIEAGLLPACNAILSRGFTFTSGTPEHGGAALAACARHGAPARHMPGGPFGLALPLCTQATRGNGVGGGGQPVRLCSPSSRLCATAIDELSM